MVSDRSLQRGSSSQICGQLKTSLDFKRYWALHDSGFMDFSGISTILGLFEGERKRTKRKTTDKNNESLLRHLHNDSFDRANLDDTDIKILTKFYYCRSSALQVLINH